MNPNHAFRYLHMGVPNEVERLKQRGDFAEAIAAIDRRLKDDTISVALRQSLRVQRELIRRLPADYPLDRSAAIALGKEQVSDFEAAEFDALEAAGRIDWIFVDGKKRYFDRYFETLLKTDASMARRAGAMPTGADGYDAEGHLERALKQMRETGSATRRLRCRASVQLKESVFEKGKKVRAYLPIPRACPSQSDIRIERVTPKPTAIAAENAAQRVIYWEEEMESNHPFIVEFSYLQTARYADVTASHGHGETGMHLAMGEAEPTPEDLAEIAPHVIFTPCLKALAETLTRGISDPLEQARSFYDYITQNVKYTFMRPYFCLENIAESCAIDLVGDCGVMALLFLTLCRIQKIPARWESGWKAEPGFCGAHDWVRFYVASHGWLFADPSFGCGAHRQGKETRRKHYFGNIDPYRMVANAAFQADFPAPKAGWRVDPYDNQVGEMEVAGRGLTYDEFLRTKEVLDCYDDAKDTAPL